MARRLSTLATNSARQLDVFGHDGNPLGVDRTQIGVLEQSNEVGLASFLQGHHGGALESEIGLEILSDLTDQSLERELADQQLRALLVATDLTKSDSSRTVAMRLLHSASSRCAFTCSFRRQLLAGSFSTGGFTSGLLGSRHLQVVC